MTRRAGLSWAMVVLVLFAGCTSKKWGNGATTGALIGAAVGGGAGVGVSEGIGQDSKPELARGGAIGAAVGLIIGGLIGHYAFDEDIVETAAAPPEPVAEAAPAQAEVIEEPGALIAVVDVSHFGFNQSTIPPSAYPALDKLAAQLVPRTGEQLILEGHTDDVGTQEYNYKLGLRRAEAVRTYLAEHGVPADRMTVRSQGKLVPVASNDTAEGRAKNRRVEIRSLGRPPGAAPAAEGAETGAPAAAEAPGTAPAPAAVVPAEVVPAAEAPAEAAAAEAAPAAGAAAEAVPAEAAPAAAAAGEAVPAEAAPAAVAAGEAVPAEAAPAAVAAAEAAPAAALAEVTPPPAEAGALLTPVPEVTANPSGRSARVIYFPANAYDLNPQAVQVLDAEVEYLRKNPAATITVVGHNDGVVETNRSTSSLRAERVRMYLISRGIVPTRITTKAEGSSAPLDTSGTPDALPKNRCVELTTESGQ